MVVALGVALTIPTTAGCGGSEPAARTPGSANTARTTPSTGDDTAGGARLKDAVLTRDQAPAGTKYVAQQSGPQSLEDLLHTGSDAAQARAALQEAGYEGAYRSLFQGTVGLARFAAGQRSVASFALVFPSADAARRGRALLDRTAAASGTGARRLPAPGLGQASTAIQAEVTQLRGSSFYYSWQQGTTVRALIDAGGSTATDASASLALARRTAARSPGNAPVARQLVIPGSSAPAGTAFQPSRSGPRRASEFGTPGTAKALVRLGLRTAYASLFQSSGLVKPRAGKNAAVTNLVSSSAQAYDSAAHASDAYHLFLARTRATFEGQRFSTVDSSGLGAEGAGFQYLDESQGRKVNGVRFLWRSGDRVLDLAVVGSAAFAQEKVARALANEVDAKQP
ncbi:MAG: hypothetical protein JWR20_1296 [Marmoricola sp.]|nr:hypothetical protein [Marmoricola sp.]